MDQVAAEVLVYLSICCFELTSSSWIKDELKEPVVEVVTDSDTSIKVVGPVSPECRPRICLVSVDPVDAREAVYMRHCPVDGWRVW